MCTTTTNVDTSRIGSSGFTLIELMIVVAIIGILASLATSAYQTYTVRAQVAEGLNMAAGAKVPIVDAYTNDGVAPCRPRRRGHERQRDGHFGQLRQRGRKVQNGRLDITFGGPRAHQAIIGETLSVTPYETNGNNIVWRCGNAPHRPNGVLLQGGDPHLAPTVQPRYLPSNCS